jgi:hypothetical protein
LANAAALVLGDNGKTLPDFLDACLTAVATNPKPFLAALAKYWPKPETNETVEASANRSR